MERTQILDNLKQARRALDSLSQVKILDDWKFDNELKVWLFQLDTKHPIFLNYLIGMLWQKINIQMVKLRYILM